MTQNRESWGSKFGFILAAAGSAVGLGNIWKFPYIAGEYGGGAFVLVYLATVLMIGFSIMIAEMLIGYLGRKDGVTSFEELEVDVLEFSPEPGSKVMDIPLSEVHFPKDSIVGIINHHGHLSIARGSSQLTEDDIVLVFAKQKAIPKLRKLFSA